jgi:hypothetical protein
MYGIRSHWYTPLPHGGVGCQGVSNKQTPVAWKYPEFEVYIISGDSELTIPLKRIIMRWGLIANGIAHSTPYREN